MDVVLNGRYRLLRTLGQGGMGEVWQGVDTRLNRPVAVKLIRLSAAPSANDYAEAVRRFEREAQAMASLNHPNVVAAYDFGIDAETDTPYLVMEMIEGRPLTAELADRANSGAGPFPVGRVLAIGTDVCAGLAAAHAAGVVHRDLKPANLMTVTGTGRMKIVDFGTARGDRLSRVTQTGLIVGTVAYIAPEMLELGEIDGRADLYALACVLYELLTSRSAFDAVEPAQFIAAHLHRAPTPLRDLLPDAPEALEMLLLDMLAKEASDRPATASEVSARLAAALPTVKPIFERPDRTRKASAGSKPPTGSKPSAAQQKSAAQKHSPVQKQSAAQMPVPAQKQSPAQKPSAAREPSETRVETGDPAANLSAADLPVVTADSANEPTVAVPAPARLLAGFAPPAGMPSPPRRTMSSRRRHRQYRNRQYRNWYVDRVPPSAPMAALPAGPGRWWPSRCYRRRSCGNDSRDDLRPREHAGRGRDPVMAARPPSARCCRISCRARGRRCAVGSQRQRRRPRREPCGPGSCRRVTGRLPWPERLAEPSLHVEAITEIIDSVRFRCCASDEVGPGLRCPQPAFVQLRRQSARRRGGVQRFVRIWHCMCVDRFERLDRLQGHWLSPGARRTVRPGRQVPHVRDQ